jgi:hypothetical protein
MEPDKKSTTQPNSTSAPAPKTSATESTSNQSALASNGQKTNTMAVVAIVLAFLLPIVGLILGIVALSQIKKRNEGGKGLAIASIIISVFIMLMHLVVLGIFWGAIFTAKSELNKRGVNINTSSGTIDIQSKDGESASIGNAKVPSGFPSSIPIYPGSKVVASTSGKNGTEFTVFLSTTDSKSTVESYYQSELKKNGWVNESDTTADLGFASGAKYTKDARQLLVTITQDNNNKATAITLIVTPENQ